MRQTAAAGCATLNGASFQDLSGARLSNSPRWKFNAGAEQRFDLSSDLELTLGGVVNYQSKINFDPNKEPAGHPGRLRDRQPVGLGGPSGPSWSVTAFVNNVGDKLYLSNISDVGGRWGNKPALSWLVRTRRPPLRRGAPRRQVLIDPDTCYRARTGRRSGRSFRSAGD
ncbi:hypothetical protein ACRAWD_23075 [Caulobacter segnis]